VLKKIRDQNLNSFIPTNFATVKGDDIPLSMFQGRDTCAISVHQYYDLDYHNFFAQIEPIFWKYDGRPHWGKLHTLNARLLEPLYPKWKDFLAVREALDPGGRFPQRAFALGVRCARLAPRFGEQHETSLFSRRDGFARRWISHGGKSHASRRAPTTAFSASEQESTGEQNRPDEK